MFSKEEELAKIAAKNYREKPFNKLKAILEKENISQKEEDTVSKLFKLLLRRKHLEDFMINNMGYSYLENKQVNSASIVFKSNTMIFPNSPNAHDSYAEVLNIRGDKKNALKHYKIAISLAKKQKNRQLERFKKNLLDFKNKK